MKIHYRRIVKGFTLLELAVVTAIMCILLAIVAPTVSITQPNATANQMWRLTEAASENYMTLVAAAQVDPTVPARLVGPGFSVMHILAYGASYVAPAYQSIYNATGIKPLSHLVNIGGPFSTWVLTNSPGISVSFSYTDRLVYMSFAYVPIEVTRALADRIQPGIVLQTGYANYGVGNLMRYSCADVNTCQVDLLHWIPW